MNSFHHTGEERELFKHFARSESSRSWIDATSPSHRSVRRHTLRHILRYVLFVLLAGALGFAVALVSSAVVSSG